MDNLDALSSDGEIYEQRGDDIKFVGNERKGVELELGNKQLAFKFCYDGCMDKEVIACYNSTNPNRLVRGDCGPGQCEFRAGVSVKDEEPFLWFKDKSFWKIDNNKCETAIMKYPKATPNGFQAFASCEPLKHDGNVVKLYVLQVPPGCPFYVSNAKKWTPPTTTPTQNSSALSQTKETTSNSSEANTTLWICIGIFILLIVMIGFGYCCYRSQIQKKPLFGKKKDVQQKAFIPEASKKANVVKEKTADEKEVVAKPEPTKESTKEESTVAKEKQPKPTKKKALKEKKAPVIEAKLSKEVTQENATKEDAPQKKVSVEPTLEDPTIEASFVQKSVVQQKLPRNQPRVFVPKKVILPAMNSDGVKNVSLLDTLSGAEDDETQHSIHASEKPRKNEFTRRIKGSKKHR
uniref:Uncharacterized protein n=1 Tax=Panagrolaimus davidi TaxID=227884 RepID=A0A914PKR9_9BILA